MTHVKIQTVVVVSIVCINLFIWLVNLLSHFFFIFLVKNFKKKVERELAKQSVLLQRLYDHLVPGDGEENNIDLPLPITTEEQLHKFEEELQDICTKNKFVSST